MGSPKATPIVPISSTPAASTRAFKCLDVFDKSHGYKRLWLFNTFVIMYVVIVVTFTALEMLCLTVENVDVRDMIDDYRLTRIGVEKQHVASFWKQAPELFMCNWLDKSCRGLAEGPSAHVYQERAGITDLKWGGTRVDELPGDMDDPRLMPWWKELRLKLMKVDQTMHFIHGARFLYDVALDGAATGASLAFSARSNNRTIYAGKETALQLSFTGTTGDAIAAPVTGMVGGCTEPTTNGHVSPCDPILLPVFSRKWEKSESGESMQINVRYLTKAIIDVGYYGDDYWVGNAELQYSPGLWSGSPSEARVEVVVRDASQPWPFVPHFTGTWRMIFGMFMLPMMLFIVTVIRSLLQYWIMTRSLFNRQQHPPFYASMRRYRGW